MFGKKKQYLYCGKTHDDMMEILYKLCDLEDEIGLTEAEQDSMDTAIQCVTDVLNAMVTNGRIEFDD